MSDQLQTILDQTAKLWDLLSKVQDKPELVDQLVARLASLNRTKLSIKSMEANKAKDVAAKSSSAARIDDAVRDLGEDTRPSIEAMAQSTCANADCGVCNLCMYTYLKQKNLDAAEIKFALGI